MPLGFTVRPSAYHDSVALMRVAEEARRIDGVGEVAAVMGTEANRAMLSAAGLWPADAPATGVSDLIVVVSASTDAAIRLALARVDDLLSARRRDEATETSDVAPRSLLSAARRSVAASVAVIAVPGPYAAAEAHQALSAGLHVFLFSDGVALEDEIALKLRARGLGRLVMGPECGTAIVNGVGLGFANRVRRGGVGVVGASGTGIQEITTLVHRLGAGISHAIGTGGRDLHAGVDGVTTLQGLERLGADPGTAVVVIVSKPSSPAVADRVLDAGARLGKPVVACLLGYEGAVPAGVSAMATLEEAATAAVRLTGATGGALGRPPATEGAPGAIRGLYSGGTLCDEARRIVGAAGHRFVDFGGEEYTRGRPHPIIDPVQRHAAVLEAADESGVSVLLLDLVLGDCAHPDPAGALAPVLGDARERARRGGRPLAVVAHVVGADADPQGLARQEDTLRKSGAIVCVSNRIAALTAKAIAESRHG